MGDKEKVEVAPEVKEVKPAVKEEDNLSELETRFLNSRAESEDGLDFEPNEDDRSPSPAKIESIPEDGEIMSEEPSTSKKSASKRPRTKESRHSSRSTSKSSRSSSPRKPKQY